MTHDPLCPMEQSCERGIHHMLGNPIAMTLSCDPCGAECQCGPGGDVGREFDGLVDLTIDPPAPTVRRKRGPRYHSVEKSSEVTDSATSGTAPTPAHDPLCPAGGWEVEMGLVEPGDCRCKEYAQVRADERRRHFCTMVIGG